MTQGIYASTSFKGILSDSICVSYAADPQAMAVYCSAAGNSTIVGARSEPQIYQLSVVASCRLDSELLAQGYLADRNLPMSARPSV